MPLQPLRHHAAVRACLPARACLLAAIAARRRRATRAATGGAVPAEPPLRRREKAKIVERRGRDPAATRRPGR